jgi:hypothetical protein
MDRRRFRPHLYAGATPVVVWRSLAGCFIGLSDPDPSHQRSRSFDGASLWCRLVGLANHPASGSRRGSCAGPAPSISAAIRRGQSRCAPVAPDPSSADRAETDLVAVEIAIGRAPGSRAWGSRWSRSSSSPRAEESSSARAAAPPGRPTAPGAAACPG